MSPSASPPPDGDLGDERGDQHPTEPYRVDPRVVLANERTLLAWDRTALAFIAGGLAVTELLRKPDLPGGRRLIGLPLIATGALIAIYSQRRWRQREESIAAGQPLSPSKLPWLVSAAVVIVAVVALVVAAQGVDVQAG